MLLKKKSTGVEAIVICVQELVSAERAIRQLVDNLDMRKDECLERTFKGVAMHFAAVFKELVPGGQGHIVMQRRRRDIEPSPAEPSEDEPGQYIGIKVCTSTLCRTGQHSNTKNRKIFRICRRPTFENNSVRKSNVLFSIYIL